MAKSNPLRTPFIAVTSLFFMWGFITVLVDALIPRLKEVFELSFLQAGLVQFAWFMAYGLVSIPAGLVLSRIGYKKGILLGLALAGFGCVLFFPAADFRVFGVFLGALFVLAAGITVLQVAANPYISVLGRPERAASRLNLAQAFNSLGTTLAPIIAASYLLSDRILTSDQIAALPKDDQIAYYAAEASAVQGPFVMLGMSFVALAILLYFIPLPKIMGDGNVTLQSMKRVLKNKRLLLGAIGIFVYVGAEVAIGSFLTSYFMDLDLAGRILENPKLSSIVGKLSETLAGKSIDKLDAKGVVGTFVFFYWGMAMIGRFVGAGLTTRVKPANVLFLFALGAVSLLFVSFNTTGFVAMFSILAVGFFNSVMFPTIFTLSLEELGDDKPEGSGILCTAIVGGAFIPGLVGSIRDASGTFTIAFLVAVVCYLYIAFLGYRNAKYPPVHES